MHTKLLLPKVDKILLEFIAEHPTDMSFCPNIDRIYKVAIKYSGRIYRVIYCESDYEMRTLIKFLLNMGIANIEQPNAFYDTIINLAD